MKKETTSSTLVLHTITPAHWSVLAVRGIDFQALLYDGKRLEQHSELTEVVYCALEEMLSFTAVPPIGHLKSPYQEDNWSCGHRLIMAIEMLLQQGFHLKGGTDESIEKYQIPDNCNGCPATVVQVWTSGKMCNTFCCRCWHSFLMESAKTGIYVPALDGSEGNVRSEDGYMEV